jgi:hypothetical protein
VAEKYEPGHVFGSANCRCQKTGPENTYEVNEGCPLHGVQQRITAPPVRDAAPDAYDPPPGHYATGAGIDPWAVWDAFDLDRYTANAVKYLLRAGKKTIAPRLDDLIKARNYINKAIEMERRNGGTPEE